MASSSTAGTADARATGRASGRWNAVAKGSRASSIRAAACVVLALACSAIASIEPLRIWQRPCDPAAQVESVEVEADADARRRGDEERLERALRVGGHPIAAHVGTDEPARIDEVVEAD